MIRKLLPQLRFPEFRDSEEWEERKLEDISPSVFDGTHQTPQYITRGISFYSVENLVGGNKNKYISQEDYLLATSKNKPEYGDILITRIGKIGFSAIVDWDHEFSIYVTLAVVKKSDVFNSYYLHCYFQSERYQSEILGKSLLTAAPCKINMDELRKTVVLLPSLSEQRKIAECLASIDDRITLETQKLDALRVHKKGLMQQLFPAEGQTLPPLRFPKFRNAGEWNLTALGKVSTITSGGTPNRSNKAFWNGSIPWVTTSLIDFNTIHKADEFISESGLKGSSAKLFPKNTILMAMYGQGKTRGKVAILGIEATTNQACAAILLDKDLRTDFLFQNLVGRYDEIRELSNRGGQENLSAGLIEQIPIFYPTDKSEQQKIANCLTSLDELIILQAQTIDALKLHKKGLMQQLFPAINSKE